MTTDAFLSAARPALLLARLGGLSVLERQLFLLRRAGLTRVWVGAPRPPDAHRLRLPEGLALIWAADGAAPAISPPYLSVSGDHLVRLPALKHALSEGVSEPMSWQGGILRLVVRDNGEPARYRERPLASADFILLTDPPASALTWLLQGAVKGTDGFMARHVDRRISLAVTRRLLDTKVTPNQMTLVSVAIGLAGAALFSSGTYGGSLAGAVLIWLHSTLDGCDGELARLRFQESPLGGVFDFWGDNAVHAALFLGMGLGLSRYRGGTGPLLLGLVAAASAAASAALAYAHSKRRAAARGGAEPFFAGVADLGAGAALAEKRLAAAEDALAQRDFIYLLVLFTALGRSEWFLWASAVGSPIFLAVLLWLHRQRAARPLSAAP